MKPIIHTALGGIAAVPFLIGTAAATPSAVDQRAHHPFPVLSTTDGAPVELAAHHGSEADRLARHLMAREIERAQADRENPLVLVGMGRLNDTDEMLFVQIQSPGECGSGGCSTVSFRNVDGQWVRVMDTVGGSARISSAQHRGMPDLLTSR
jgi:hypothetical protein